jgi:hypothetical protein
MEKNNGDICDLFLQNLFDLQKSNDLINDLNEKIKSLKIN